MKILKQLIYSIPLLFLLTTCGKESINPLEDAEVFFGVWSIDVITDQYLGDNLINSSLSTARLQLKDNGRGVYRRNLFGGVFPVGGTSDVEWSLSFDQKYLFLSIELESSVNRITYENLRFEVIEKAENQIKLRMAGISASDNPDIIDITTWEMKPAE